MRIDITLTGGAGEYMETATLVAWTVEPGAMVTLGQIVAVVETAKAATEIEAPAAGILCERLVEVGTEIAVGSVLGRIESTDIDADGAEPAAGGPGFREPERPAKALSGPPTRQTASSARVIASPYARRIAREAGLDLTTLKGTGPNGRIKSRDLAALAASVSRGRTVTPSLLVMIHGFGSSRLSWSGLAPRFGEDIDLLLPDLPCHGKASARVSDLQGLIDAVEAEIAAVDGRRRSLHIVGHSLGGAVAARIAAAGRVPVASLTLLAPAGLGPEIDGDFIAGFLRATRPESLAPWLSRLVADQTVLNSELAATILAERIAGDLGVAQAGLAANLFPDGTQAIDIRNDLKKLDLPTKVIWGVYDRIIPVTHLHMLPAHVAAHRIDGLGHMPHVEAPALVERLIRENMRAAG
jgi:pyruvate dehydrogenase E2 component (dihydrolipoamide acetyltransferase)